MSAVVAAGVGMKKVADEAVPAEASAAAACVANDTCDSTTFTEPATWVDTVAYSVPIRISAPASDVSPTPTAVPVAVGTWLRVAVALPAATVTVTGVLAALLVTPVNVVVSARGVPLA